MQLLQEQPNKSEKLTDAQRKLIEENYDKIRITIKRYLKNFYKYRIFQGKPDIVYEVMSYIPELTMSWCPIKGSKMGYVGYVSFLCIRRYIDKHRNEFKESIKIQQLNEAEQKIRSEINDYISDADIKDILDTQFANANKINISNNETLLNNCFYTQNKVDFEDIEYNILKNSREILKDHPHYDLLLDIIENYHLKNAKRETDATTLAQLSQKYKIATSYVCVLSRLPEIKCIFARALGKI